MWLLASLTHLLTQANMAATAEASEKEADERTFNETLEVIREYQSMGKC